MARRKRIRQCATCRRAFQVPRKNPDQRFCSVTCKSIGHRIPVATRMDRVTIKETGRNACWIWSADLDRKGYGRLKIAGKWRSAHRLAWELTYGPIPKKLSVLHQCDRRNCLRPSHLRLGTQLDNLHDASRKGRIARGERHGHATLTREIVLAIRHAKDLQRVIAARFGISQSTVSMIRRRKAWRHLP
jgi:HNH endonuclease